MPEAAFLMMGWVVSGMSQMQLWVRIHEDMTNFKIFHLIPKAEVSAH